MAILSGAQLNAIEDRIALRFKALEDGLAAAITAEGPPYGSELLHGRDLYDHLVELRASGDPAYYEDPAAAEELARLAELYGPPPPAVPFESPIQGVV